MWLKGIFRGYSWCAKVYETESDYGINGGTVSKLSIKDEEKRWVTNYDRGWDICPKGEVISIYTELLDYLESLDLNDFNEYDVKKEFIYLNN